MVTRNDVARAAGVSTAVVSYVINDGPRAVSPKMRSRVLAAIDELGYRPNTVARSMRTRRTNSIGFVLPDISMAYFSAMTQYITERARERGLSVMVATSSGDLGIEREHVMELAARQVDGIILMSVDPERDTDWATSLNVPVVVVDRPRVAADSTALAAEHLLAHGCRSVARVSEPETVLLTRRRDDGWSRTMAAHGITHAPVVRAAAGERAGFEAASALLQAAERVDGVVIDDPAHATGFLRAAADLGIDVPGEVAVIACEYGRFADFTVPRLSSVDSPLEAIAARAVEAITAAASGDRQPTLDGPGFDLFERDSCRLPALQL